MKFTPHIFLIIFILYPIILFSQTQPTATVFSNDTAFCGTGDAALKIRFTGEPPYTFLYELDGSQQLGTATQDIFDETFVLNLNLTSSSDINITRVYDNNYQYNSNNPMGSGVPVTSEGMHAQVDEMPSLNAGLNDETCGLDYTFAATITDALHDISWINLSGNGIFSDNTSPNTTFTASTVGSITFTLKEVNGTCEATDDVEITFKGNPTATITSGDTEFCSTDDIDDYIPVEITFTGNGNYTYVMQDNTKSYPEVNTTNSIETIQYPVTESQTFTLLSVKDEVTGCSAEPTGITGKITGTDLKSNTFAGEDKMVCGSDFTLEAAVSEGTTGTWSTLESDININNENLATSTVTSSAYQYATFTWTETKTGCVSSDDVTIHFVEPPELSIAKTSDQICDGTPLDLDYIVTGNSPWTIKYNDGNNTYTEGTITSSNGNITVKPSFDETMNLNSLTEYQFTSITGGFGCETTYSDINYAVTVDEMPVANAGPDQQVCSKEAVLDANPSIGEGSWTGVGSFSDNTDPYTTFTSNDFGIQNLIWTETNGECIAQDIVEIDFQKSPYPVSAGPADTITIYAIDNITLNADSVHEGSGRWSFIEGNGNIESPDSFDSRVMGLTPGTYTLEWTVTAEGQCPPISDELVIISKELFPPTGFSPNGDNLNEQFKILGAENISNNKLSVFNIQGKLVFSSTNYQNDWRGTDKGGTSLPEGTYYYVFEGDQLSTPVKDYLIIKR